MQVQRRLGHHSPAFALSTYVHLLDDDLGAPVALPSAVRCLQVSVQPTDETRTDSLAGFAQTPR
ncbi:MAG: hypothetical protein ACR2OB_06895 [Solirubrobacteraceae bacterium]